MYGTRTYLSQDGESRYAWDGDDGWNAFFVQSVRPVVYGERIRPEPIAKLHL
ncbi:hypothetical protein FHR32_006916 [Streptosporangium album]|uniref:Uncharacterized protein n=1 Tax=Streptosporangium album TaxID=47479 RepID=A0A7W7S2E4_9ACTN|nr:hypothetical protein [Streptosporangium album]MBB4942530.1 hypothetical protein [Streptosporangium album]